MKIISSNKEFKNQLIKLIEKYDEIRFSVAWASSSTKVFNVLLENRAKIRMSTIGTHFYQTDPDVLEAFINSQRVKFVKQPSGVFHPKVYFFSNSDKWEAIIGSANMTSGAMEVNQEMSVHISSYDNQAEKVRGNVLKNVGKYFEQAESVSPVDAASYRKIWQKQKAKLKKLSAEYGSGKQGKPPIRTRIMAMDWDEFVSEVKKDPYHGIENRLNLLKLIHDGFKAYDRFKDMPSGLRKTVAGLPNKKCQNWAWFGSMKGAGVFHSNIKKNNPHISDALSYIRLEREILKKDYLKFIDTFLLAFPDGRDGIGTASRLLAMKRPDIFVCIDQKNNTNMCRDFGITSSGITYERYWDELIGRIHDSVWWQTEAPANVFEKSIWENRAALLDCIFYEED